jgi:hypothetical protein
MRTAQVTQLPPTPPSHPYPVDVWPLVSCPQRVTACFTAVYTQPCVAHVDLCGNSPNQGAVCVCVCVCVRERERESVREKERERERESARLSPLSLSLTLSLCLCVCGWVCVCVCVCVCRDFETQSHPCAHIQKFTKLPQQQRPHDADSTSCRAGMTNMGAAPLETSGPAVLQNAAIMNAAGAPSSSSSSP